MDDNQKSRHTHPHETPTLPNNPPVSRLNRIIWQFIAALCFTSGIISCLPLANSLLRLLIGNFLLLLLLEGLFVIPCALVAIGIGFGALKFPLKNQKYWQFFIAGMVLGLIALVSIPLIFPSYREEFRKFSCSSNLQSRNVLFIDGAVGRGSGSGWLEEAKTNVYHKNPLIAWTKRNETDKK